MARLFTTKGLACLTPKKLFFEPIATMCKLTKYPVTGRECYQNEI